MKLIQNGTLVSPHGLKKADILVVGGKIKTIADRIAPPKGAQCIDAHGCLVFPGFIDAHTHLDMDSGVTTTADDFQTGSRAAVVGGTTTLIDFATQSKGESLQAALDEWHKKADGRCSCNYGFHMAICDWSDGVKAELKAMCQQGVTSFKAYMAYDSLRLPDKKLYEILQQVTALGGVVGVHCENGDLVEVLSQQQKQQGNFGPAAHPLSRPPAVEAEAVARLLRIAQLAKAPVHIVHLSCEEALNEVRAARKRGQTVYVETCPQYLLLDDACYNAPGFEGAKYVLSPPLRKKSDSLALLEAVQTGEVETISTDHCSYNFATQKTLGKEDFTKIPNGGPGIEHRPALIWSDLVKKGLLTPEQMCALLAENPARLFGLYPQKGVLAQGSDGDIVVWQPDGERVISAKTQLQNLDYTPYEGHTVTGGARHVLVNGQFAVKDGCVLPERRGKYVHRSAVQHPVTFKEDP